MYVYSMKFRISDDPNFSKRLRIYFKSLFKLKSYSLMVTTKQRFFIYAISHGNGIISFH